MIAHLKSEWKRKEWKGFDGKMGRRISLLVDEFHAYENSTIIFF